MISIKKHFAFALGLVVLIGLTLGSLGLAGDEVKGDAVSPAQSQSNKRIVGLSSFQSPLPTPSASPTPTREVGRDCRELRAGIPDGRVVTLSSDCQINDFETQAQLLADKYGDPTDPNRFLLPFNPHAHSRSKFSVAPDRIIGSDDRIKISDTTVFPWTAMVKIQGQWNDSETFSCSGWMLGPSTLVTAGHCVYSSGGANTYAYNVTVTPALNTDAPNPQPFGVCRALRGWVLLPWYDNADPGYDYGVYDLGCRIGYQTGNLGMKVISGSANGTYEAVAGYPGDKGATTLWSAGGTIQTSQTRLFFYDNDMMPGQSGGPVWVTDPACNPCAIAVNAHEYAPPTLNSGARITLEAFNFFLVRREFIARLAYLPLCLNE